MAKIQVINKLGIEKEYGYLYYIDQKGNVMRKPMRWKGSGKAELIVPHAVKREKDYFYFITRSGDVARVRRATA